MKVVNVLNIQFLSTCWRSVCQEGKAYVIKLSPENFCAYIWKMVRWSKLNILLWKVPLKVFSVCFSFFSTSFSRWNGAFYFSFILIYMCICLHLFFALFGWLNTRLFLSWNANALYWWSKLTSKRCLKIQWEKKSARKKNMTKHK